MSAILPYVRDVLNTSFVLLLTGKTVAEAKEQLTQAGGTTGVIVYPGGAPLGVVTTEELLSASDFDVTLEEFPILPTFIVDADTLLNQAVSFSAQTLVDNPKMLGLVVEDKGKVIGILTRQTIIKYTLPSRTRGGSNLELAGDPQSRSKYFVCPKKPHYRKLVSQYDPDNPPMCPKHNLVLVKQT